MVAAAVVLPHFGGFARTKFSEVSRFEDDQFYFEPEISPEHCFEDIVGNGAALQKVLELVGIVAPTRTGSLLCAP